MLLAQARSPLPWLAAHAVLRVRPGRAGPTDPSHHHALHQPLVRLHHVSGVHQGEEAVPHT